MADAFPSVASGVLFDLGALDAAAAIVAEGWPRLRAAIQNAGPSPEALSVAVQAAFDAHGKAVQSDLFRHLLQGTLGEMIRAGALKLGRLPDAAARDLWPVFRDDLLSELDIVAGRLAAEFENLSAIETTAVPTCRPGGHVAD